MSTRFDVNVRDSIDIFKKYVLESVTKINEIHKEFEDLCNSYCIIQLRENVYMLNKYKLDDLRKSVKAVPKNWLKSVYSFSNLAEEWVHSGDGMVEAEQDLCDFLNGLTFNGINVPDDIIEGTHENYSEVSFGLGGLMVSVFRLRNFVSKSYAILNEYKQQYNEYISSINSLIVAYSDALMHYISELNNCIFITIEDITKPEENQ